MNKTNYRKVTIEECRGKDFYILDDDGLKDWEWDGCGWISPYTGQRFGFCLSFQSLGIQPWLPTTDEAELTFLEAMRFLEAGLEVEVWSGRNWTYLDGSASLEWYLQSKLRLAPIKPPVETVTLKGTPEQIERLKAATDLDVVE